MGEPISLMDLKRKRTVVEINNGDDVVEIMGVTAGDVCSILERFPPIAAMAIGGDVSPMEVIIGVPGALAAWVAATMGKGGDAEAEKHISENLTIEDASHICQESLSLTFSRGFMTFQLRLQRLMAHINLTVGAGREPDTESPMPLQPAEAPPTSDSGD